MEPPEPTPPPPSTAEAGRQGAGWRPDAALAGFECLDLPLDAEPEIGEPEDALVGTLVRRADPALRDGRPAWLYVHGWNDYFFQTHLAEVVEGLGYAFHAVDLRRYGRSHRDGQLWGYVADLSHYEAELDAAVAVIRHDHDRIVGMGHSTGGLTISLWASGRPGVVDGLVLNSPWLEMHGPPALAALARPLLQQFSGRRGTTAIPIKDNEERIYARAAHADHGGEWNWDLTLKSDGPRPLRLGWLRAILAGHARVAAGLGLECPVFVATSDRTVWLRRFADSARTADTVLDVERIGAAATRLGRSLTLVRIPGGMHDLTISQPAARAQFFDDLTRWERAWVSGR
ncbi:alpha/beta hydrolase [Propioniciclava soli]|uniref:alpha/beta hydrolase n=1 Tax=Propioniciclava soli TaxID=2775081 RepID=UPI001E2C6E65